VAQITHSLSLIATLDRLVHRCQLLLGTGHFHLLHRVLGLGGVHIICSFLVGHVVVDWGGLPLAGFLTAAQGTPTNFILVKALLGALSWTLNNRLFREVAIRGWLL